MNEITNQIIEIGKLIGKRVSVKRYIVSDYYYNYYATDITFTTDDFEYYAYGILNGIIKLKDIGYSEKFGNYYLIIFDNLK